MRKRTASGKSTSCWRLSFWRFSIGFRIITALFHN
nr:MAG TPA: TMPK monophosphate kinase [Caudoviricetes sp.]